MYLTNLTRIDILNFLPKNGEVAEIGVAEGAFSSHILEKSAPCRLHLIDPWEHQAREDYQTDQYGNPEKSEQESRFRQVASAFADQIASGQVVLHRAYSTQIASTFEMDQFDWIYVDGLHSHQGVTDDLNAYLPKVKKDGFIVGHDYTNHGPALESGFGVVEAVNDFVLANGYHFLLKTMENFPTYVLTKSPESLHSKQLLANLFYFSSSIIELKNYPAGYIFEHKAMQIGDKTLTFPVYQSTTGSSFGK